MPHTSDNSPQFTLATSNQKPPVLHTTEIASGHTFLDERLQNIANQRKRASESQIAQAETMVKRSKIDLKVAEVGDNVAVPVPLVDRGRGDPRNILGVVVNCDEHDLFSIAVKAGILSTKYTRNQFDPCPQRLLKDSDMNTECTISRSQAIKSKATGGHCDCSKSMKKCKTNR
jgi:hypothetical protein